jgi:hypothetical protein
MAIADLWSDALMSSKAVDLETLNNSNGKTIGIDYSIWLHRVCENGAVGVLRHPPVVSRAVVRLSSSTVGSQHYCK